MEHETDGSSLTCPFYVPEGGASAHGTHIASTGDARRCRGLKCAVWVGREGEGRCALVAIAEALAQPAPAAL
jgi:hypothetical protein